MIKTEEDKKLEKIGRLLELGGTMLAQHCDCGAPLFRYQGNVMCPICDSDSNKHKDKSDELKESSIQQPVLSTSESLTPDKSTIPSAPSAAQITHKPDEIPPHISPEIPAAAIETSKMISPETYEFLKNTIVNKIVQICLDLQRETDLSRIKQQMEVIESGTRVLNNLK